MNLWTLHRRRWLAVGGMILAWFGSLPIDMKLLWVITFMVWWNIPVLMGVVSSRTAVPPVLGSEDSLNGLMSKKKLVWIIYYCLCGHQVSSLVDHLWMILDWRVIEDNHQSDVPALQLSSRDLENQWSFCTFTNQNINLENFFYTFLNLITADI